MKKLFPLIKNRLGLFIIGAITGVASGFCTSRVITMIKTGLDSVDNINENFIFQIIGYSIIATILGIGSGYFIAKITSIVIRQLTQNLSEKILKANYEYIESASSRIVPVLTRDITMLSEFINRIPQFLVSVTTVVATLYVMFLSDWKLTSFFMIAFVLQIIMVASTLPLVRKLTRNSTKYNNYLYRDLSNLVSGLKELSLNEARRNDYISLVISENLKFWNKSEVRRKVLLETNDRLSDLLVFIFSGLLMYAGATILPIDFYQFKVILPTILFLIPFTTKIASFFRLKSGAMVSLEQIHKLGLDVDKRKIESSEQLKPNHESNVPILKFSKIKFQYQTQQHENPITFGPLDIAFKKNNITFIIGGNGSGKTTFSKILTGLYIPISGSIQYYDEEVKMENLISYRNLFSAYYADSHVFEHLSHIEASYLEEKADNFINMLEMESKVEIEGDTFSTISLSYGQRSRLALIANMLDNKDIYVFDEWAANQDPYFKGIFYHKILPYLKEIGKTIIVISHDEKYFEVADEIIELQEGMINSKTP
ncbi:cyclic peptide export ABC transporter [Reichenbachiella ulvae]|uniref:Cyclic peptide export ABC transporter n=1 Tax=Reichenbachiella ulvae TaxID=2980104 RepID=A0ABT3CTI0_9BACT|nr:cyclic peptide export ABC transporter [Reichenbachiella ulvae]MCV9386829.1 cyclic peptide export ABC transporter [Reichenbachiella ulvae]